MPTNSYVIFCNQSIVDMLAKQLEAFNENHLSLENVWFSLMQLYRPGQENIHNNKQNSGIYPVIHIHYTYRHIMRCSYETLSCPLTNLSLFYIMFLAVVWLSSWLQWERASSSSPLILLITSLMLSTRSSQRCLPRSKDMTTSLPW